jgi:hypothetical protein
VHIDSREECGYDRAFGAVARRRAPTRRVAPLTTCPTYAPGDVRVEDREDPKIVDPTDAIIRLSATCICGSDLWPTAAPNRSSTG